MILSIGFLSVFVLCCLGMAGKQIEYAAEAAPHEVAAEEAAISA